MKDYLRLAVVGAIVAPLLTACQESSLGPEYREVSEEESGLQFYAPGLKDGFRNILRGSDDRFNRTTSAMFGPRRGEYPHGYLNLVELSPDMHYARVDPLRSVVGEWEPFQNKKIVVGAEGAAVNGIGRIRYLTFQADGVACVIFQQPFGRADDGGVGDRLLAGYYCAGPGDMMSAADAETIVKAVGHRRYGAAQPAPGWDAAGADKLDIPDIPFSAAWGGDGGGEPAAGKLVFTAVAGDPDNKAIRGDMLTASGPHGECKGGFELAVTAEERFHGEWFLFCADGVSARGTLSIGPGGGDDEFLRGSGTDSEQQPVTLSLRG